MKTNELNNGIKEVYTKPALAVGEMEVQWSFMGGQTFSGLSTSDFSAGSLTEWLLEIEMWEGDGYDMTGAPRDHNACGDD